ncbi:MAG: hypothetical protein MK524_00910 [SAR202 cluster bacterium]|nr:hypothetical protein [SAR202 cluster bacterium]
MKMEVITVAPKEQRVLLMFGPNEQLSSDSPIRSYLQDNGLEPKREYKATRESTEYNILYFGHCYLDGHMDALTGFAEPSA